jgi:Xaa-Pro aminopeptidase
MDRRTNVIRHGIHSTVFVPAIIGLACMLVTTALAQGPEPFGFEVYKARRQTLLDSLSEGTAILYSQGQHSETGYRADGHFWYLTGLNEPGAILVLSPGEYDKEILLLPPRDMDAERWTGERPTLTEALTASWQFDRISRTTRLNSTLVGNMKHEPKLHLISRLVSPSADVPKDLELYRKVSARIPGVKIENSSRLIESMRMIKTPQEVERIERAIHVTHAGLTDLIKALEPGITEYQLDGILEESFKSQGAQHMAFSPIVGTGKESTILHYETRDKTVEAGQLLLLDVGAEWDRYAADISRTLPVDGAFSPEQAEVYDVVLAAQQAAIDAIKPGITLREIHEIARDVIRQAGYVDDFIHSTSHHLGLDVHDVADYGMPLAPGMVITVEPGIYLPDKAIGVRIEDDILVTEHGHRVLSDDIPRERAAVEAWLKEARR